MELPPASISRKPRLISCMVIIKMLHPSNKFGVVNLDFVKLPIFIGYMYYITLLLYNPAAGGVQRA
jgi:hypothetical protein